MTKGKHWKRKDRQWTEEIENWILAKVPVREHGYRCRQELLDELNATFGTSFSITAFCTHCYESGIQLGLAFSNSKVVRGEAHWRHRPSTSIRRGAASTAGNTVDPARREARTACCAYITATGISSASGAASMKGEGRQFLTANDNLSAKD